MSKKIKSILKIISNAKLQNKQRLDLSNYDLDFIPKQLFKLRNQLKELILSNNSIKELPSEIKDLKNLEKLYLSNNRIKILPKEIQSLTNLEILSLSKNRFSVFPVSVCSLSNLKTLNISENRLASLPEDIHLLVKLERLILNNNKLKNIPIEIGELVNLERLYLNSNSLVELPSSFCKLKRLKIFYLNDNPFQIPPIEIANRDFNDICNYFESLLKSENLVELREAKLLLVGEGNVGKTCLKERLVFNKINLDLLSTEGIEINHWKTAVDSNRDFRVNTWDFGGQEIYHSTHQFFLTKRSLYILVWEARNDDNLIRFDYWLNVIKLLGANSPVIIVLNKIDERIKMIDEEALKEKFPNIYKFHEVSALNGTGIEELRRTISQKLKELPHVGDKLPEAWDSIRKKLQSLKSNSITYRHYLKICKKFGLTEDKARYLSRYLHDLGMFLHFQENLVLQDVLFLRPEWATKAVYKVLDTKDIITNYGKFHFTELKKIWDEFPDNRHLHLLELMKKFELCFRLPGTEYYIVTELLPVKKAHFNWDDSNNLQFEYKYKFMPSGIITRFIVLMHHLIYNSIYWRNGVILKHRDAKALIVNERLNRRIRIYIEGHNKIELLSIIREKIDYIHQTLNYPDVDEMVPCICEECIHDSDPYAYLFESLKKAIKKGKHYIECPKTFKKVDIKELFGEYNKDVSIMKDNGNIDNERSISKSINSIEIMDGQTIITDNVNLIKGKS